ncbi:MAG: RimK family alpha-L-glutamate ligase [Acidimicrobiales bacterium]
MRRVALATCAPGGLDPDEPALLAALGAEGIAARAVPWDARDPFDDDLVIVRSTWDYSARLGEFLEWAASVPRLANPYPVLAYSADKAYLGDLADRGHPVVATTFVPVGQSPTFPEGDVVVKPRVGAGSRGAARYGARERPAAIAHVARLHAAGRDALVQPYVTSVDEVGERALVFIDGAFSHAMTKAAMLNVDEAQRTFSYRLGRVSLARAEPDALALARAVLADQPADLLYARVDVVRDARGWVVMELELVEPSLFLAGAAGAAAALARAVARRVA